MDEDRTMRGLATLGALALTYCGEKGIFPGFRAWAEQQAMDTDDPPFAIWIGQMRSEYLTAAALRLLLELEGK